MNLPTDPKKRMQVLVGIGVGVLAVIVAVIYFGVMPTLAAKKAMQGEIQSLQDEIDSAQKKIDQMPKDREKNREVLTKTREITAKYFIRPVLTSYPLRVNELIEPEVRKLGLAMDASPRDMGVMDLPEPPGVKKMIRAYTSRISLQCGYNDLRKLVRQIEESNPYLSVLAISIAAGDPVKSPEAHAVSLELQWPTWGDRQDTMDTKLDGLLAAMADEDKPRAKP